MRIAIVTILAVLFAPTDTWSQETERVEPGRQIRVTHGCDVRSGSASRCSTRYRVARTAGAYRHVSDDSLVFDAFVGAAPLSLPLEAVHRIEVVQGQKSRWLSGMGLGLVVGTVGGAVIGYAATADEPSLPGIGAVAGLVLGAPVGLLTGGIVGAFLKTERWQSVPLHDLRATVAPQTDGRFALGLSARF